MIDTLNKDSIHELHRQFNNFLVSPRSTIPTLEDLINDPETHVWIYIDQFGQVITRPGKISSDDREDITTELVNCKLFKYLLDTGMCFLIGIEICQKTNSTNVEIILGSENNAITIKRRTTN